VRPASHEIGAVIWFLLIFLLALNPVWALRSLWLGIVQGSWRHAFYMARHVRFGQSAWAGGIGYMLFHITFFASAIWGFLAGLALLKRHNGALHGAKIYFLVGVISLTAVRFLGDVDLIYHQVRYGYSHFALPEILALCVYMAFGLLGFFYLSRSRHVASVFPMN
jgi:hypothetical protein